MAPDSDAVATDVVTESDNTLVRLINSIIDEAIAHRASDIHIETETCARQRARAPAHRWRPGALPGAARTLSLCHGGAHQDHGDHGHLPSNRKPQDGKIDFALWRPPELRVVTVPTPRGLEDVVLRLLAGAKPLPLENIGLSPTNLQALREVVKSPTAWCWWWAPRAAARRPRCIR